MDLNSKNSWTSDRHSLSLTVKMNLKKRDKYVHLLYMEKYKNILQEKEI